MNTMAKVLTVAVLLVLAAGSASLGQAVPGMPGYYSMQVPPQTEVLLTVPYNPRIEKTLTVNAAPAGATLSVAEDLTGLDYSGGTWYVRFIDGGASGLWSTIQSNNPNSVTLSSAAIAGLATNGCAMRIYRHNTIGSLFPSKGLGLTHVAGTEIVVFDNTAIDTYKMGKGSLYTYQVTPFFTGWSGGGAAVVIPPETMFILRNKHASKTLVFACAGTIPDYVASYYAPPGAANEVLVGSGYPVGTTVNLCGFNGVAGREIVLYSNTTPGLYKGGQGDLLQWVTFLGQWTGNGGTKPVPAAAGYIFRQGASEPGGKIQTIRPY